MTTEPASITGRQRLLQRLSGQAVDRVPWVPFTGVQIANLVSCRADELLQSADLLTQGNLEAHRRYRSDGQPVVFDLQIEAEILGCDLHWVADAPPSVISHPLEGADEDQIERFINETPLPSANDGRVPIVLEAMRRVKAEIGQQTALYGLVTGPFTLASHLRGSDLFMDLFDEPEQVRRLVDFFGRYAQAMADLYAQAGMDVIAPVDPMISQIGVEHFNEAVAPAATGLFTHIRALGKVGCFFVCGNATRIIQAMADCKPEAISVDENVDLDAAIQITQPAGVALGGNLPLATVMLQGSPEDNIAEALRLTEKFADKPFILSPGCDLPFNTPPENVAAVGMAVHEPKAAQQRVYEHPPSLDADVQVELPDYGSLERPLVEVMTLDSRSCAACQYMVVAVKELHEQQPASFDWAERSILYKENVARVSRLGVRQLPSIVINGETVFESIVPSREMLRMAVEGAANSQ